MKIIYVCNEYPPAPHGGIGTFVRSIAQGMIHAGHEVKVVGWGYPSGTRFDGDVQVTILPSRPIRGFGYINRLCLYYWLYKQAQSWAVDIIEVPEHAGLLPFPFHRCSVVVRLHQSATAISHLKRQRPPILIQYCEYNTLRYHRNWIAVSHFVQRLTEDTFSLSPTRSTVIYNPAPPNEVLDFMPDDSIYPNQFVLYAGTVTESKGALILAEACRKLLAHRPTLHLVYAGAVSADKCGAIDSHIQRIIGPQLSSQLHFLGRLPHSELLGWMHKATVVAAPSRLEAFSLVPLEAMSCKAPIVYTKAASGPEAIDDGVTGLLVDPYDSKDIAEKISLLLDHPQLAQQLIHNASRMVRNRFSVEKCVEDTLTFYNQCLYH